MPEYNEPSLSLEDSKLICRFNEFKLLLDKIDREPFRLATNFCFKQLDDIENRTIVEMGCGKGFSTVFFAMNGGRVIGFDMLMDRLGHAQDLATAWNVQDRCDFVCCDLEHMPINMESADLIFSRSTLQYVDTGRTLSECKRVLKPEGTLVLIENLSANPFLKLFRLYRKLKPRNLLGCPLDQYISTYLTFDEINEIAEGFLQLIHNEYKLFGMFTYVLCRRYRRFLDTSTRQRSN